MNRYEQTVALWKSYRVSTAEDLDRCLDSFRVLFAFHSGKIENDAVTYHDTRELFENGKVLNFTGNPRTLFEQQNQKLCYEFLKQRIIGREPVTIPLIREIHRVLTGGTYDERRYVENGERPGEFKRHDYVTGLHEVGSSADRVEGDLQELADEVNSYGGSDVLKVAVYLHVRFEYIHPFADGNGRVGRTLLNYWLMTHDYPPLIVYDEDKALYYECLQKYDENEELMLMYEFAMYETEKTWGKALSLAECVSEKRKSLKDF